MKIFVKEQLSEHKYKTPQGYLICTDAIIARTGKQTYKKSIFFPDAADGDIDIEVDRHEKDVFDEATMASFENMPITVNHPQEEVNSKNNKTYAVGYVRDVHKGNYEGKPVMMANLVFTDEAAIQKIENGEMSELSCGYDCDVKDENNPYQENIRGNHVALCQQGRAGIAKIQDSIESSTKKIEELGETRFIEYDEKEGKYFIASGDSRFDIGFNSQEEAKEFWLKNKDFIRNRVARDSNVVDALVQNEQELNFIKNAKKIRNQNGKIFVLKDDNSGYCSFDGGTTWYSGNVRVLPERDAGRKQESRWLRVNAMGHEGVISLAKLKYASQYGEIPNGYEVDHLNGNHMDDKLSNYELVTSAENQKRNQTRIAARHQQDTNGYVSRSAIERAYGKQQLELLEKYNDYDRFTFKDSVNDTAKTVTVQCYIFSRDGKQILTQERPGPVWPGIAVPGGHIKADETPLEACVREVREETGLEVRQLRLFGVHEYKCEEDGDSIAMLYTTNDYYGELRQSEEGLNKWYLVDEVLASPKCADGLQELLSKCIHGAFVDDSVNDIEPKENESKDDFISRFMSETKSEYPDEKQRLAVAYSYWKKHHGNDCNDSLVEEPRAWAEMKRLMQTRQYKVDKEGKTLFGRHHLEFVSNNKFDATNFRNEARQIDAEVSKVERQFGTPATYNIGLQNDGTIRAVIDIDTKYVADALPDAVKKALHITKMIK